MSRKDAAEAVAEENAPLRADGGERAANERASGRQRGARSLAGRPSPALSGRRDSGQRRRAAQARAPLNERRNLAIGGRLRAADCAAERS